MFSFYTDKIWFPFFIKTDLNTRTTYFPVFLAKTIPHPNTIRISAW